MALNILLCKFVEALIKTDTNIAHRMKITSDIVMFIIEYIITQNSRDITKGVSDNASVMKLLIFIDLLSALR
jgi:hypothetical protein